MQQDMIRRGIKIKASASEATLAFFRVRDSSPFQFNSSLSTQNGHLCNCMALGSQPAPAEWSTADTITTWNPIHFDSNQ